MNTTYQLFCASIMIPRTREMDLGQIKSRLLLLVAEFFYCGRSPYAPGTVGSLGALLIWVPLLYSSCPSWLYLLILISLFFLGLWASSYGIAYYKKPDPKQVVIDEVVGIGIPFLVLSPHFIDVIVAFLLFRFFDIVKPWPIKIVERRFKNAWGVMLDDVIAGFFALVLISLAKFFFNIL